jgi:hypothetical protein
MSTLEQAESRANEAYFNVPSSYAMTRNQAVKEAKGRNHSASDLDGICWQGEHGSYEYLRYSEMTESERKILAKHL